MLNKFLLKRVAVLTGIAMLAAYCLDNQRLMIPLGLVLGALAGLYRTRFYGIFLGGILQQPGRIRLRTTLFYLFSQTLAVALLVVAVMTDVRLFVGIGTGLLLPACIICCNGVTEKLGITRNEWGDT